MKKLTYILFLLLLSVTTEGQDLVGYEYWFDTDFSSKVYTAHTQSDVSFDADVSVFRQGMHYITFRIKDDKGKWSTPLTQYFYRTSNDNGATNTLESYEYWLDTDYTERKTVESTNGTIAFDLNASTLRQGMHCLNFRAKDKRGNWSNLLTQYFYRTSNDNGADNTLTSYEYWLDTNYTERKTVESTNGTIVFDLDASILRQGIHYLNFRTKDKLGNWSSPLTQYFMKPGTVTDNKICQYSYWLNNDLNTLKTIDITPVTSLEWNGFLLDVPEYIIPESMPKEIQLANADKKKQKSQIRLV